MVLEEAALPPETFRDDSSPTSDVDRYSSAPGSTPGTIEESMVIDMKSFMAPMPIIGPLMGYTSQYLGKSVAASVLTMSKIVKRPLTYEECSALAYHGARASAIASYGFPLGVVGGLWRASNTRSTYRFPFFQPDMEKFDPKRLGPLSGARAELGWQIIRRFTYAGLGGWFGKLIVGTYAATVAATGTRLDPRMKDIVEALRSIGNEEAMKRTKAPNQAGEGITFGTRKSNDTSRKYGSGQPLDAMSDGLEGTNTGVLSDRQVRREEAYQQQADYNRPGGTGMSRIPDLKTDRTASQASGFDFDDASPTAGSEPSGRVGERNAWDRLRKGQTPSQSQSRDDRGPSGQSENPGDSFSFSKSDEERQLAKSQAQQEFDARLERERQGRDFDDNRRWR